MKKERPVFLCEFPPPLGGVTVKNRVLYQHVFECGNVEVIDFSVCKRRKRKTPGVFVKMLASFKGGGTIVYGFGSYKRLSIALVLQRICAGKKSLEKTIILVMGGSFPDYIQPRPHLQKLLKQARMHYVETKGMKERLEKMGISRVGVFPNARSSQASKPSGSKKESGALRCVYFSGISTEKGVPEIIKMCQDLNDREKSRIRIDFYGPVSDEILADFQAFLAQNRQVRYLGVFDAANRDAVEKLSEYDVLLFPSRWKHEGVPGVLVEAKMAGIVPVVRDWNYNAEIVKDGAEGFVIKGSYPKEAKQILLSLNDRTLLERMKAGSFASRKAYAIEHYEQELRRVIYEG